MMRQKFKAIELAIRAGRAEDARKSMGECLTKGLPLEEKAQLANFSWRIFDPSVGVRLLASDIARIRATRYDPSVCVSAVCEYAVCLLRLGAFEEARALLNRVEKMSEPKIHLYQAAVASSVWDHKSAIAHLKQFLASRGIPSYSRLVALTNLASCYVFQKRHTDSTPILRRLLNETKVVGLNLLHGNALELSATSLIWQRRYPEARVFLKSAEVVLKSFGGSDLFFVRKWSVICELLAKKKRQTSDLSPLHELRREATARRDFNTVRECDRIEALAFRNEQLFWSLYFGTASAGYRHRLCLDWGKGMQIPKKWRVRLGSGSKNGLGSLDIDRGIWMGRQKIGLRSGGSLHRMLISLAQDRYRPVPIAGLFEMIFPEEFFDCESSPARVHQAIKLLRKWFKENQIPILVKEEGGGYRLESSQPVDLILSAQETVGSRWQQIHARLREAFSKNGFSAAEAGKTLGVSSSSALKTLNRLMSDGLIAKEGIRRSVRYRVSSPS